MILSSSKILLQSGYPLNPTESSGEKSGIVQVIVKHEKAEFLLCSLFYGTVFQQALDLNFTEGEEVTFFTEGRGKKKT